MDLVAFFRESAAELPDGYFLRHKWPEGRASAGSIEVHRQTKPVSQETPDGAPERVGRLAYGTEKKRGNVHQVRVKHMEVHQDHQRKGLASAMMDRLQSDYPEASVDHGWRTQQGQGWWDSYAGDKKYAPNGRTAAVTVPYIHNTERSPHAGDRFGQDIEPHGRYLSERSPGWKAPEGDHRWETGEVTFHNPKHVDFGGGYQEDSNWKRQLSKEYGGRTGHELSHALVADGHDGIITHDDYGTSEIVDLTGLHRKATSDMQFKPDDSQRDLTGRSGVTAHQDGNTIGHLYWHGGDEEHPAGQIANVWVHPSHQRKGLATELLRRAREIEPRVHHSPHLSEDGRGWSEKTAAQFNYRTHGRNVHMVPIDKIKPSAAGPYEYWGDGAPGDGAPTTSTHEHYEKLRDHIAEHGIQNPLVISRHSETGDITPMDGNHRLQLAKELGHSHVPAISGEYFKGWAKEHADDLGEEDQKHQRPLSDHEMRDLANSKTAAADRADMPPRQRDAFDEPSFSRHRQKILDVAKDPDPGTHIWRGETRSSDKSPAEHADSGVGMHWSANPDALVHQHPDALPQGHHSVVWHGVVGDHPKAQTYDRSHPIWGGQHHSADFEAEVRLKPQSQVHLKGAYTWHGEGAPEGFVPNHPDRMHPGWKYHPLDQLAPVSHGGQHIDYDDVLGQKTAFYHGMVAGQGLSWDEIGERHPHLYGEEGDGDGIGYAANHLAHSRPEDPEAEDSSEHELTFHKRNVNLDHIDYASHGRGDSRVRRAMEGYKNHPDKMPPLVLVHRHGIYHVADGHHRAEAAYKAGLDEVPAYVAHSPHPHEPFGDGESGASHGAEPEPHRTAFYHGTAAGLLPDGVQSIHRGMGLKLSPEDHAIVHDPNRPHAERAQHLLGVIGKNGLGSHWTSDPGFAEKTAHQMAQTEHSGLHDWEADGEEHGYNQDGSDRFQRATHVVMHAKAPASEHVDENPDDAYIHGYDTKNMHGEHEREIPLKSGAPVHLTGISWGTHSHPDDDQDDAPATHHSFGKPLQLKAALLYLHDHPWLPEARIFSPTKSGEDPRLFDGDHLKPELREFLLEQIGQDWDGLYPDWPEWSTVYFAGGEASSWYGSHAAHGEGAGEADDFDVLVGVDFNGFRHSNPAYAALSDEQAADRLNQAFRAGIDQRLEDTDIPGIDGRYGITAYVNVAGRDIREIRPYAAYNVSDDKWTVEPYQTEADWSARSLPESYWDALEGLLGYVRGIQAMPEPFRSREGARLFDQLHDDRRNAFGPGGTGVFDYANVQWKYLDLHPERPLDFLLACKRRQQSATAVASVPCRTLPRQTVPRLAEPNPVGHDRTASAEEAIRHERGMQQVHNVAYPDGRHEMLCGAHLHLRREHDSASRSLAYETGLLDEGQRSPDQSLGHGLPPAQRGRCADCTRAQNDPESLPWKQRPKPTDRVPDRMSPFTPHKSPEKPARHVAPFSPLKQSENRVKVVPPDSSPEPEGIMIAVVPPEEIIDDLVVEGGETPENIHITVCYLGHTTDYSRQQLSDLVETVTSWAETYEPFEARTQGAGTFVNDGSHVLWAAVDAPALTRMHVALVDYLREHGYSPSEDHSFTPHITLKYDKYHIRFLPKITPADWLVKQLWVAVGGRWESVELG